MATLPRDDIYVGEVPKIRITTPDDVPYGDMVFGPNGAYWRSAKENNYLFLSWESLKALFETKGALKAVGAVIQN